MNREILTVPEKEERSELQTAKNLQALLKQHHLSVSQLAQRLGIPMMTIRRLLLGETADPRISTLKLVADYFKIPVDTLVANHHPNFIHSSMNTKPHFVPVLSWVQAAEMSSVEDFDLSQWKEWHPITLSEGKVISNKTYALESRPSMHRRFPRGTLFIIDPEFRPNDGDLVLVKIKKNNELTLRELTIDPPEWHLYPIVSESNRLQYSEKNYNIVGVVVLTLFYNRKL